MKTIVTIVLSILIFNIPASAQQVKFGVEAGANLSHYKSSKNHAQKEGGMGVGFQIGGTVDYEFKHHWMLMSGVSFMQTQSKMELIDASVFYFPNTEIKLNHLFIPLKVGYNIPLCKNINLIPFIGIYGSLNFSAGNCSLTATSGNISDKWKPMNGYSYIVPSDLPYDHEVKLNAFRNWSYGAIGGVKAVIASHYTVSLQYYESIMKIQKQCGLRNYGYQLSVGYLF